MTRRVFVLSALLLWQPISLRAERLPLASYTVADNLAHTMVNRIVRDSRGLLWFCTPGGCRSFRPEQLLRSLLLVERRLHPEIRRARQDAFCERQDALYVEFVDGLGLWGSSPRIFGDV